MGFYGIKDVFRLARQLEENGQLYYEIAASECKDPSLSILCSRIATQEEKHLEKLKSIEQQLFASEQTKGVTWEELTWLQLDLEEAVSLDIQEARYLVDRACVADILARAIQMELESMTFYKSLMSEVSADCIELLDELVKEEAQHMEWLQQFTADH